ncbi:hypothetical protein ACLKA6_000690 [Drosophila palustris]
MQPDIFNFTGTAASEDDITPKRARSVLSPSNQSQPPKKPRAKAPITEIEEIGVILDDLLAKVYKNNVRSINQAMKNMFARMKELQIAVHSQLTANKRERTEKEPRTTDGEKLDKNQQTSPEQTQVVAVREKAGRSQQTSPMQPSVERNQTQSKSAKPTSKKAARDQAALGAQQLKHIKQASGRLGDTPGPVAKAQGSKVSRLQRTPPSAAHAPSSAPPVMQPDIFNFTGTAASEDDITPKRARSVLSPSNQSQPPKKPRAKAPITEIEEIGVILDDLLAKVYKNNVRSINQAMKNMFARMKELQIAVHSQLTANKRERTEKEPGTTDGEKLDKNQQTSPEQTQVVAVREKAERSQQTSPMQPSVERNQTQSKSAKPTSKKAARDQAALGAQQLKPIKQASGRLGATSALLQQQQPSIRNNMCSETQQQHDHPVSHVLQPYLQHSISSNTCRRQHA